MMKLVAPSNETTTAAPGADNPQEKRTCRKCDAEKVVSPLTWPHRKGRQGHYQAHGAICMDCEKVRKSEYEERRDSIAKRVIGTDPVKAKSDKPQTADRKAIAESSKMDVARALKAGSITLNDIAPAVMAKMLEYFEDDTSPHHEWAMEFLAQRIMPRKLYEELGGQAAGVGALQDKRPQFILNINTAQPGASGAVYENEVPALSAPEETTAG